MKSFPGRLEAAQATPVGDPPAWSAVARIPAGHTPTELVLARRLALTFLILNPGRRDDLGRGERKPPPPTPQHLAALTHKHANGGENSSLGCSGPKQEQGKAFYVAPPHPLVQTRPWPPVPCMQKETKTTQGSSLLAGEPSSPPSPLPPPCPWVGPALVLEALQGEGAAQSLPRAGPPSPLVARCVFLFTPCLVLGGGRKQEGPASCLLPGILGEVPQSHPLWKLLKGLPGHFGCLFPFCLRGRSSFAACHFLIAGTLATLSIGGTRFWGSAPTVISHTRAGVSARTFPLNPAGLSGASRVGRSSAG